MPRTVEEPRSRAAWSALAIVCGLSVAAGWIEAFFHLPAVAISVDLWLAAFEGSLGFWFALPVALGLAVAEGIAPRGLLGWLGPSAAKRATAVGLAWALLPPLLRLLERSVPASSWVAVTIALAVLVIARRLPDASRMSSAAVALIGALLIHALSPFAVIQVEALAPSLPERADDSMAAADSPCLLLIVVDTLRNDRVGGVRDGRAITPFLDRLAADGTRSSLASTSNQTGPSHASLLTGSHVLRNGIFANGWSIPSELPTFAELMREAGWRTGAVTSNPVIRADGGFARGFECYGEVSNFNSPVSLAFHGVRRSSSRWRLLLEHEGFARFWMHQAEWRVHLMPQWLQPSADDTVRRSSSLLGEMAADPRPWFLFAHFMDPHGPYNPPPATRGTWSTAERIRGLPTSSHLEFRVLLDAMMTRPNTPEVMEATAAFSMLYDEEVLFVDSQLERLVAEARSAAGARPLWIVFTSDHGEHFLEHGLLEHSNSLFEELVRLPLIVHGVPKDADLPSRLEDLPRFLLRELVGEQAAAHLAEGSPQLKPGSAVQIWGRYATLHTDRWKLFAAAEAFRGHYEAVELWDLASEEGERRDVSAKHPEVAAALLAELQASVDGSVLAPRPEGEDLMDERMQRRLAEVGYATH